MPSWDETFAAAYRRFDRPDAAPGRVLRAGRGVCTVLDDSGVVRASLGGAVLARAVQDPVSLPCAGDWVVLRRWPDRRTTLEHVLPRRTALTLRLSGDASAQALAANMDTLAVIEPLRPTPDLHRVRRLLGLARESGAEPLVILSKSDTCADPAEVGRHIATLVPAVPVLTVSARSGQGVGQLRAYAGVGRTLALLGCPGAGRSTLVEALAGVPALPAQRICDRRATVAYPNLVLLPGAGAVLDVPEIRGLCLPDRGEFADRVFADLPHRVGQAGRRRRRG